MTGLSPDEMRRLDGLLERFDLSRHRDLILGQGSPCITAALIDPPDMPDAVPVGQQGERRAG